MKAVLGEREIDISRLTEKRMREILSGMDDFKFERDLVERTLKARGHQCIFLPKYHCELKTKKGYGAKPKTTKENTCDYTFISL